MLYIISGLSIVLVGRGRGQFVVFFQQYFWFVWFSFLIGGGGRCGIIIRLDPFVFAGNFLSKGNF